MNNTITIEDGQTIWDIAIQLYGGVEDVFKLVDDNKLIKSVSTPLQNGWLIEFDANYNPEKPGTQQYFQQNGYKPRTGDSAIGDPEIDDGGLDEVLQAIEDIEDNGVNNVLQAYNEIADSNGN